MNPPDPAAVERVSVALRLAAAWWPRDAAVATSESTALVWAVSLASASVDDLCDALERLSKSDQRLPSVASVVSTLGALAEERRRAADHERLEQLAATPLLTAAPATQREILAAHRAIASRLISERVRFETHGGRFPLPPGRLAEIQAQEQRVGPFQAAALTAAGIPTAPDWGPPLTPSEAQAHTRAMAAMPTRGPRTPENAESALRVTSAPSEPPRAPTASARGICEGAPTPAVWAELWRQAGAGEREGLAAEIRRLPEAERLEVRRLVQKQASEEAET